MSVKQRKSSLLTPHYHFTEFHTNGFYVFFQNFSLYFQEYTYITIQFLVFNIVHIIPHLYDVLEVIPYQYI